MKRIAVLITLALCVSVVIHSLGKDELLMQSRFPYFAYTFIDMPKAMLKQEIRDEEDQLFAWEKPYYDLLYGNNTSDGLTLRGFIWLYDTDVFYGRGDFPEARRSPLFEGNNYNRTFNNDLMRSDDFIQREGVVRGRMDIELLRTFDNATMSASAYIISGENFSSENSTLYFNHVAYDYSNIWHFRIGEVYPYFDDFTLNKKETPLPGFEMSAKFSGGEFYFIAARPDFPLDFAQHTAKETILYAHAWDDDSVIHHFTTPYNMFEVVTPPVHVYRHDNNSGVMLIEDITDLCEINHAEVIIPRTVLTPNTQKIVIVANTASQSSQQTMYLNAFQLQKKWEFDHGYFDAACVYVDLHNDTHSTENIQGLVGPMDSNIWSIRAQGKYKTFKLNAQYATSKFTPDDNKYNTREIDSFYSVLMAVNEAEASFHITGRYTKFGADYLPNLLTLRDAWKIQQDNNADFKWDYESAAKPGTETYNVCIKFSSGITHSLGVNYSYDLASSYKQQSKYAGYDPLYIDYYGTDSNGLRLYGEGIDDGRTMFSLFLTEGYKAVSLTAHYIRDKDDTLIITPEKRDTKSVEFTAKLATKPIDLSLHYLSIHDDVRFDPQSKTFITREKNTTFFAEMLYHHSFELDDTWSFRVRGKLEYINDADTLYDNRSMPFRTFIAGADVVGSNVLHHDGGVYAYYTLNAASSFCVFYVLDIYRATNSYDGRALDYFRYNRGIKFTTTFGITDAYLNAFYDEDVTEFSELTQYTQSFKRIGAMLSMTF